MKLFQDKCVSAVHHHVARAQLCKLNVPDIDVHANMQS